MACHFLHAYTPSSRYAIQQARPPKDPQQDITDVTVTQAGGVTTLQFTRKRVTGDTNDLALDSPFYLLFAWNGPVTGVEVIGYHGAATRAVSFETVTIPTAQQCTSEYTLTSHTDQGIPYVLVCFKVLACPVSYNYKSLLPLNSYHYWAQWKWLVHT